MRLINKVFNKCLERSITQNKLYLTPEKWSMFLTGENIYSINGWDDQTTVQCYVISNTWDW